jgi:D-threo-aldose 1-dehydrogenase
MLTTLVLPQTTIRTSVAGYGCVGLTAVDDERRALQLLQRAFDGGITHFDVARVYGLGQAERILGRFLKGRRGELTVTTKFGLTPPPIAARNPSLVSAAKKVLRHLPGVDRVARQYVARGTVAAAFTTKDAEKSLHASLEALQTEYVDVLLLHEADLADARSDELLAFAEREIARGTVRCYGIGSGSNRLSQRLDDYPPLLKIIQFDNDIVRRQKDALSAQIPRAFITHGALRPLDRILQAARANLPALRRIEPALAVDLAQPSDIGALLLGFARYDNPGGIVLFGSTRPEHIDANIKALEAPIDTERMMAFASFTAELLSGQRGLSPHDDR